MFYTIGAIILGIVSIIVCLVIALQEAKSSGLGAGIAGGSDTYWSRNKAKSKEGRLVRITVIASVIFFVLAILLNVRAFVDPAEASASQTDTVIEEVSEVAGDAADDAEGAVDEAENAEEDVAAEATE